MAYADYYDLVPVYFLLQHRRSTRYHLKSLMASVLFVFDKTAEAHHAQAIKNIVQSQCGRQVPNLIPLKRSDIGIRRKLGGFRAASALMKWQEAHLIP